MRRILFCIAFCAAPLFSQYTDFSAQTASSNLYTAMNRKPDIRYATSAPATCSPGDGTNQGDIYINTATWLRYYCTATNTWTLDQSTTGSAFTNCASGTTGSITVDLTKARTRCEIGTLTGNITVAFTNKFPGLKFDLTYDEGVTPFTVTYGSDVKANMACAAPGANIHTVQRFEIASDGTTVEGLGCPDNSAGPSTGQIPIGQGSGSYGPQTVSGAMTIGSTGVTTLAPQYRTFSCQPGMGDGLNAITAGTYLNSICYNDTGVTVTITGIKCFTDNNGTSTLNVTNGTGTGLLTGSITCSNSFAPGAQSATTTIASGDFLEFTFVSDGASKQSTWVVTETK